MYYNTIIHYKLYHTLTYILIIISAYKSIQLYIYIYSTVIHLYYITISYTIC